MPPRKLSVNPELEEYEIPDSVTYMSLSDMMNMTELPIIKGLKLTVSDELPVAKGCYGWILSKKTVTVLHFIQPGSDAIVHTIIVK